MAAVVAKAVGRIGWANPSGCFWLYAIGRTMIDTGPPSEWSRVRGFVEKHGIERVVVGHHHEDHAGNAGKLVKMGLQVLAPAQTIDLVRQPLQQEFYRRVVWGSAAYPLPLTHEHNLLPSVVPIPEAGVSLHLVHAPYACPHQAPSCFGH